MQLSTIVKQNAAYVDRSGYVLDTNSAFSFVAIESPDGEDSDITLQGHEADAFIQEARDLYDKTGDCTMAECLASVAYAYVS